MNSADPETNEPHDAIWREFSQRREVNAFRGRIPVPPAVSAMLGFVMPVTGAEVEAGLAEALAGCDGAGCLTPFPPDYWHITVVPPALLSRGTATPAILLREAFAEQALAVARDAVRGYGPFEVRVKGVNAFKDVVVAIPYDGGHSRELSRRLRGALPQLPERYLDGHTPLPHISLAQYKSNDGLDVLAAALAALREQEFGSFQVDRLEIFVLSVDAGVPGTVRKHPIPLE
jgi:2'-5' RNA ligase